MVRLPPLVERLLTEGYAFDFFQAVRLLARVYPERRKVGLVSPPSMEIVRFQAHNALDFPPSAIYDIVKPTEKTPVARMTVTFMGLTGPSGVLPRGYTELLMRIDREGRGPEKDSLRAWLDLFNHRLISLFYRAWEKYRFHLAYEEGAASQDEPDAFTRVLYSLIGLGMKPLRGQLSYSVPQIVDGLPQQRRLAAIDDLALLYYSGLLAQRPRSAMGLQLLLQDYFQLAIEVQQVRGRWLLLERESQTRMGHVNADMGVSLIVGERVWEMQSKFRLRVGPVRRESFDDLLPDRTPQAERKTFFLLTQLTRLYVGPELDFDIQLILRREDVPGCQLQEEGLGARLGWNTWLCSQPAARDADDAVFEGLER